jgi:hypothetical protein
MRIDKHTIFLFLLYFLAFGAFAQEESTTFPLKKILQQIGEQHHISFNYAEDEIVVYALVPPKKEWTLQQKIDYIKKRTSLGFKAIGNSFTLYNDKKMDKPLCGFIRDSETGEPIENATLVINDTPYGTTSDHKGYFELPIVSPNPITLRHLNYKPLVIAPMELYKTNCPEIKLTAVVNTLEEIVAQRYLTTGISKNIDGTLRIIPKKFGILPGLTEPDILQTMQQIPGIYSTDESVSNINVRGGTHDQNLFLWNGIRMFQTGHFFGLISAFNPALANKITISKNGSSAFFGESVSSVVAISTHTDSIAKSISSIGLNLLDANLYTKIKTSEKASFEVSARRSFTDLASSPTYQKYYDRIFQNTVVTDVDSQNVINYHTEENFYYYDFTAQYQQKIGARSELVLDGIVISNEIGIQQQAATDALVSSKHSNLQQRNFGGSIHWKTHWNASNSTKINAYVSDYQLDAVNESVESNQVLNQQNSVFESGVRIENHHELSEKFHLDNGYQYSETGVTNYDAINTPTFTRNIKEVIGSHALIAETGYTDHNKLVISAGIRANYFPKFHMFLLEPRLRFNYKLARGFKAEVLYEQKSQTASQIIDLQQDFLGIEKRRWTIANNIDVPIQKSNQVSLGFSFRDSKWLLTIDNFYKKVAGIYSPGQAFQNQLENIRIAGSYSITGSEILVQRSFGNFYSWLSYSFNHSNYHFDAFEPREFPNNYEIRHSVSWAGIYDWNKLKLALGSKWHSGRPTTNPVTIANQEVSYNMPNKDQLSDFVQFNFSASYFWNLTQKAMLHVNVSILNIFNKSNSINRYYRVNTLKNTVESVNTYALGRTPNLSAKVSF